MIQQLITDPQRNQSSLRKTLDAYGIDSIGMNLKHARTISGGFHCVTLDLKRDG